RPGSSRPATAVFSRNGSDSKRAVFGATDENQGYRSRRGDEHAVGRPQSSTYRSTALPNGRTGTGERQTNEADGPIEGAGGCQQRVRSFGRSSSIGVIARLASSGFPKFRAASGLDAAPTIRPNRICWRKYRRIGSASPLDTH